MANNFRIVCPLIEMNKDVLLTCGLKVNVSLQSVECYRRFRGNSDITWNYARNFTTPPASSQYNVNSQYMLKHPAHQEC